MSTSVKISERAKSKLEELQAEIRLETGKKVTQQELLDLLVEESYESKDELVDSYRDDFDGLSQEEIDRWLSGTSDWGVETSEDDVDEILYDDEHLR